MKKINLIINLICVFHLVNAQGTWTSKATFAGTGRLYTTGFSIGTKGYIATGESPDGLTYFKDFWEWDQATDVWTQKADFGGTARYTATGFSIGAKGYIGTGIDTVSCLNDFWEWDQATNIWTQKTNFGGVARTGAVGFAIGTKGYIGTGGIGACGFYLSDFWEWDQNTDIWTRKADIIQPNTAFPPGRVFAIGFSINTKGYIGTGLAAGITLKDFWEWDQATDIWTRKADFGGDIRMCGVGFSIGTKGYIGTGYNVYNGYKKDFWEWNQTINIWTQKADYGGTVTCCGVGWSIGDKGYIGTGYWGLNYQCLWEYDPTGSVSVNVDELNNEDLISIFPNPTTNIFTVCYNGNCENVTVTIRNVLGEAILTKKYSSQKELKESFDLSKEGKGVYFVEVVSGDERKVKRIVVE